MGIAQAMANLDNELDGEPQTAEPVEKAIMQLNEEINTAISYLEQLPDPQGADLWGEDDIASLQW